MPPPAASSVTDLLASQDGVLRVDQALAGHPPGQVRWLLGSGRWQRRYPRVLVAHCGPLTRSQEVWSALLHCGRGAALGGPTAAELDGLAGYGESRITVLVPPGARPPGRRAELTVSQSRLLGPQYVHPARSPVRTRIERSVLDMAAGRPREEDSVAVLAASVQQRLTSPSRLASMLVLLPKLQRRALLSEIVADIDGGAHSLPEVTFRRLVLRAGLPRPDQQAVFRRANGRYYLDAKWERERVAAEIDGVAHLTAGRWLADIERQNALVVSRYQVVRFTAFRVRHRQEYVAETLRALLGC